MAPSIQPRRTPHGPARPIPLKRNQKKVLDRAESLCRLAPDDQRSPHVVPHAPVSVVVDPSRRDASTASRVITGAIVSQFFIGVDKADYILTYLITFSDGSVDAFDAVISARTFMGPDVIPGSPRRRNLWESPRLTLGFGMGTVRERSRPYRLGQRDLWKDVQ